MRKILALAGLGRAAKTVPVPQAASPQQACPAIYVATGAFPLGYKTTVARGADGRASVLQALSGNTYLLGSGVRRGHYGKLRQALDPAGNALAVKEFRLAARPPKKADTTQVSEVRDIALEVNRLRLLGDKLQVKDVIEAAGKVYLVTTLYGGSVLDLRAHVSFCQRAATMRHLGVQCSKALAVLHDKGYVHCDIKPDNLLFDTHGKVALCDFGFANPVARAADGVGGTYAFMAPELAAHEKRDRAYDIWGLALTLADMGNSDRRPRARSMNDARRNTCALAAWRKRVMRRGKVDLRRIGHQHWRWPRRPNWDSYFGALKHVEPHWCRYIVECMLHPDPKQRPTAHQVLAFARAQRDIHHDTRAQVRAALHDVAQRNVRAQKSILFLNDQRTMMAKNNFTAAPVA